MWTIPLLRPDGALVWGLLTLKNKYRGGLHD